MFKGGGMEQAEDVAILARIARGDQKAMMTFYDRQFGLVAGFCRRLVSDPGLADEVIQDVFWEVWRRARDYDPARAGVAAWLLLMARSRVIDGLRRGRRRAQEDLVDHEDVRVESAAAGDTVEQVVEMRERDTRIGSAVKTLPDVQRDVIERVFWRGQSAREVAEVQGVPLGTVKTRLRLGLGKLRGMMEAEPDDA